MAKEHRLTFDIEGGQGGQAGYGMILLLASLSGVTIRLRPFPRSHYTSCQEFTTQVMNEEFRFSITWCFFQHPFYSCSRNPFKPSSLYNGIRVYSAMTCQCLCAEGFCTCQDRTTLSLPNTFPHRK